MLVGILFLILVLAVGVLIAMDVLRAPSEAPAGQPDRRAHAPEPAMAGVRGATAVQAFPREPAGLDRPVPPAAGSARFGTGPAEADSSDRPDEAAPAFDQMRREMPQSAASEAALRGTFSAMYVNLSRRGQTLVERQLRIIESLEHGEQDRQRLASLAKLNRIAMRMHRNSQNLLVLAGREPAVRWNQPVTLAQIVEAALAEIEDYERVAFEVQPDIAVRAPAVHDTVHVLVELLDNATSFSAGEMSVRVTGRVLTSGGALIDITDQGIGMAAEEMAYANQQLDNPPPPDIDVPKWMGLLVVARLAARHGIRVRLNQAEAGGLTALVWFPDEILTHYSAVAGPGQAAAQQRRAVVSPAVYVPARIRTQDALPTRPDPAWSAPGVPATVPAESTAAARLFASGRLDPDHSVVMPQAENHVRTSGPPIYDEVESHWSRGGREAPKSVGLAAPPTPAEPTPAEPAPAETAPAETAPAETAPAETAPAETAPAETAPAAAGLARRRSAAAQGPSAVPRTPPSAPNRSGLPNRKGSAVPDKNPGEHAES
jgi:signal transduction histidine kinase